MPILAHNRSSVEVRELASKTGVNAPAAELTVSDAISEQKQPWQNELARMITDEQELLEFVGLRASSESQKPASEKALDSRLKKPAFPLRVTRAFAGRIEKGNAQDPLLLQVLPHLAETAEEDGNYSPHPLQEQACQRSPGLLQKYRGRALIIVTAACAIHCRYCFRQNLPYKSIRQNRQLWQQTLSAICSDHSLEEIIFSGGDPLMLADKHLQALIRDIESIRHVRTLRIHSRVPIALPSRITDNLTDILGNSRLNIVNVIHGNHANEIDEHVGAALTKLKSVSNALLNQTVLLRGVNDNSQTLATLSHRLFDHCVLPYYLHLLDKVSGSAHFDVNRELIRKIMPELRRQLPGYLVPRLVREIPGEPNKTPVWI